MIAVGVSSVGTVGRDGSRCRGGSVVRLRLAGDQLMPESTNPLDQDRAGSPAGIREVKPAYVSQAPMTTTTLM
jgi:hypothetical protein